MAESKTYILDDQWTDKDDLDFTPYVDNTPGYYPGRQYALDHRRMRHMSLG